MKKLSLKKVKMAVNNGSGDKAEFEYKQFVDSAIRQPPKDGFTDIEDMRKRTKILDKLDKANGSLELEDAEANTLQECVKTMKWTILDASIVQFVDDVNGMK